MILVTGATSHTGCRVVRRLIERGHNVRCLVRTERNEKFLPTEKIEIVQGDIRDTAVVLAALKDVNMLVNVAHIRFAHTLIPLCRDAEVTHVIFISSTRRYTKFPCVSATEVIEAEDAIRKTGLEYTILRPAMIYGGKRDNNMSKLVEQIRHHTIFPIFGSGKNLIQPLFVWDLVSAILYCVEHPATARKEYTLAGPEAITYRQALDAIARLTNRKIHFVPIPLWLCVAGVKIYERCTQRPRITAEQVRRFGEDKTFDIEDARRDLGFAPRSFEEGIKLKLSGDV